MSETDDPCNRTDSHLLSSGDASDGLGRAREHETDDDVDGSGLRALSRSPHPYHHQSHELPHAAEAIVYRSGQWPLASEVIGDCPRSPFPPFAVGSPTPPTAAATYSYSNSADSGTEADTEQPWRGLPAPRVRPHKGLRRSGHDLLPGGERAAVSSGVSTPLDHMSSSQLSLSRMLSPEVLEQEGRRVLLSPGSVKRAVTERDRRAIAEEVRRRKELARRGVEVLLLTALCVLVGRNGGVRSAVRVWKRGESDGRLVTTKCTCPDVAKTCRARLAGPGRCIPVRLVSYTGRALGTLRARQGLV